MNTISIAQVTDIHIAKEGESPNGIDVRANFLKVLEEVKRAKVDYMVVSGDLCSQVGIIEVYQWVKRHLDATEIPYFIMSGNHDNPAMLAEVFGLTHLLQNRELYYSHKIEGLGQLIFLDSTTGMVSSPQLSFLTDSCKDVNEPQLLFMHHPPTLAGVPHMDNNYALQNIEEVQSALKNCASKPQAIFSGHYHCGRSVCLSDIDITTYITPSSAYFQLNPDIDHFEIGSYRSAWRKIVWDGKSLRTNIKYVGSAAKNIALVKQYYEAWEKADPSLLPLAPTVQHISPDSIYESKSEFLKACWEELKGYPTPIQQIVSEGNTVCVLIETPVLDGIKSICSWFELENDWITKIRVVY